MNTRTLTIVLTNVPEDDLLDIWKESAKEAKRMFGGFELPVSDNITIDYPIAAEASEDSVVGILAGAITSHLVMEVYKRLNAPQTTE